MYNWDVVFDDQERAKEEVILSLIPLLIFIVFVLYAFCRLGVFAVCNPLKARKQHKIISLFDLFKWVQVSTTNVEIHQHKNSARKLWCKYWQVPRKASLTLKLLIWNVLCLISWLALSSSYSTLRHHFLDSSRICLRLQAFDTLVLSRARVRIPIGRYLL